MGEDRFTVDQRSVVGGDIVRASFLASVAAKMPANQGEDRDAQVSDAVGNEDPAAREAGGEEKIGHWDGGWKTSPGMIPKTSPHPHPTAAATERWRPRRVAVLPMMAL